MKTLADLKRRLLPNTVCHIVFAKYGFSWPGQDGIDIRAGVPVLRVVHASRNSDIVFSTTRGTHSHLTWPKKADVRFDGPDKFSILEDGDVLLTYEIQERTA